jgi:hypothetical protein
MAEKAWADMTADEKRAKRIDAWRNPDIEFASSEAEAEYRDRVNRLVAALSLEKPDRVPTVLSVGFWPTEQAGMTPYEAMNDPARAGQAWIDFCLAFQPDATSDPRGYTVPTSMYEKLDYRLFSWPGRGRVPKESGFQFNEGEWMLPDEYDALISDPTGYLLRTYLPRTVGAFAGFSRLPSFLNLTMFANVSGHIGGWGSVEMLDGLQRIMDAARDIAKWGQVIVPVTHRLKSLGFPAFRSGYSMAPFDILGDALRGTKGLITDMYRRPEKVHEACRRLVPMAIDWVLGCPTPLDTPIVFMPLHKGADGFMNDQQFRTLYWPTLRTVLLALIDEGFIPLLFAEGRYDSRLEVITDLPKGATVWRFDRTDLARAKETIGQIACIEGNMPLSLLHAGTPSEVAAYTRHMIDVAGHGGGYIVDLGASTDKGKAENLRAMVDAANEYGVY